MTTKAKRTNTKNSNVKKANKAVPLMRKRLPSAMQMLIKSARILWEHKQLFITITLVYGFLNLLLVRGFSGGTNVGALKHQLDSAFSGNLGGLASNASVFVLLLGSSGNSSSNTAGAYQFFLTLIVSLAIIWALRQIATSHGIRARDAFYRGMYPLVPLILVLLVVAVQLIPLLIGSSLYNVVITNGIAVHVYEKLLWGALFAGLGSMTLYLLTSSLIAVYIVTLPDMTPLKALRSARELVRGRRWSTMRKMLFLPVALFIVAAAIMLPVIIVAPAAAQWVFFLLSMVSLVAVHAYMYTLYRSLLDA